MPQGTVTTDGTKEVGMFFHSINLITKGVDTLADVLYKSIQLAKNDPVNKVMAKILKNGEADVYKVDNFRQADELKKMLAEKGVKYATTCAYGDQVYLVIPKEDREKASEIINMYYQSQSTGVVTPSQLNDHANGKVQEIKGLSETETALYMHCCKAQNIPINVVGPSDGTYRIRFAEQDLDKMARVRIDVAAMLSGPAKDLYAEQIQWRQEYDKVALNTIVSGRYPDGSTVREGSAIVGSDGKQIEVSKIYITLRDSGSVTRFPRNANEADMQKNMEQISQFAKNIESPVFLDRKDLGILNNLPTAERSAFLATKERAGLLLPREIYQAQMLRSAENGRSPEGRKFNVGDMIVDAQGNSIEIQEKGITVRFSDAGTSKTVARDDTESLAVEIQRMQNPVFLDAARAAQYQAADESNRNEIAVRTELQDRTFVQGRHQLTPEDMVNIARAEAMRQLVDVRIEHDGIELPVTKRMTYQDAALIFGLTLPEEKSLNAVVQSTSVMTEHEEHGIDELVDMVEAHYGITEPSEPPISLANEVLFEEIVAGKATPEHDHDLAPVREGSVLDQDILEAEFRSW